MTYYAGLDVSLKEISICVIDNDGEVVERGVRLAGRRGFRKAAVATARKIAVLMLTLWKTETDYQWTQEATA